MKQVAVSDLRRQLTDSIDEVARTREPLVVTRRGRPVARILPIEPDAEAMETMGLRGVPIALADDFDAPLPEPWDALSGGS